MNNDLVTLLSRTNLRKPFDQFLKDVETAHPKLGEITQFHPIVVGYEDANILVITKTGKYVIKLFLKERSAESVKSFIRILEEAQKIGIPVPRLVAGTNGNLIFTDGGVEVPYCITEFFDGKNFWETTPSIDDMVRVSAYLAKLNTLNFPVVATYDSWGNKNLVIEYDKNKEKLTREQEDLIAPIVKEMRPLHFSAFSTAVIHGDLQRKHVLKNIKGEYCLLDFGCAANGPKVIELSTHLAWFCLGQDSWNAREDITNKVIKEYTSVHHLSTYELDALPILIRACYGAYYLRTCILISEGDKSLETDQWNKISLQMLRLASLAGRGEF